MLQSNTLFYNDKLTFEETPLGSTSRRAAGSSLAHVSFDQVIASQPWIDRFALQRQDAKGAFMYLRQR